MRDVPADTAPSRNTECEVNKTQPRAVFIFAYLEIVMFGHDACLPTDIGRRKCAVKEKIPSRHADRVRVIRISRSVVIASIDTRVLESLPRGNERVKSV